MHYIKTAKKKIFRISGVDIRMGEWGHRPGRQSQNGSKLGGRMGFFER